MNIVNSINDLTNYALKEGFITPEDMDYTKNLLYDFLKASPSGDAEEGENPSPGLSSIMKSILDYCAKSGLIEDTVTCRDLADAKIMGLLMPRPSEVNKKFFDAYENDKIKATDDFYDFNKKTNYIQTERIAKNKYWTAKTPYGNLEITINLSKPEKDPRDIAAAKLVKQSSYPSCLLCRENVGFAGNVNHPARQNLRIIPLKLDGAPWYFQYSPYVYYNEHCIVLNGKHIPMQISKNTFKRLLEFVRMFPHYFIGSNADLPIVGGSILTHDHFQGGRHIFAMEKASKAHIYRGEADGTKSRFKDINISTLKWPMSVIRISGNTTEGLIELADEILTSWRNYSDKDNGIIAYTDAPHNTVTPIARINGSKEYELDLVLRNNRTDSENPLGIFHPHSELHHIKKENIGLIEVMGLAVLPGRLDSDIESMSKFLTGQLVFNADDRDNPLYEHFQWLSHVMEKYAIRDGNFVSSDKAEEILRKEIAEVFVQVLCHAGVFKDTEEGKKGFEAFMRSMDLIPANN